MAISDGSELVNDVWLRWFNAIKQGIEDLSAQVSSGSGGLGDLTRVNDTNVTLTLTGTPTGALFQNVGLTLGWTGVLGNTRGGTGTATVFTQGSIVFAGPAGVYAQDNANLFWDDTNNRLGIGTAAPSVPLSVHGITHLGFSDALGDNALEILAANNGLSFKNGARSTQYGVLYSTTTGAGGLLLTTNGNTNPLFLNQNAGPIRIGDTTTPTARLHIRAGTTAASTAPLKFTSGSLLTAPEAGAVEFLTDEYFVTITTGTARKGLLLNDGTALTSGRVPFATTGGRLTDDADLTFATDTLTVTKVLAPTSVSTPSLISTTSLTITPNAGSNLNVSLSTTGDFAVNTNQLYVDTSAARVGINQSSPSKALTVEGAQNFTTSNTVVGLIGPPTWDPNNWYAFQNGGFSESASNFGLAQNNSGDTIVNAVNGRFVALRINNASRLMVNGANVGIGSGVTTTDFPATGSGGLIFTDGTALASLASNTAGVYADDVGGTVEMFGIGEGGELARLTGVACRNSAQFDKTNTTLATVTGLTRNVAAGITYKFEAVLFVTADVTGGSKYAIAGTATATAIIYDIVLLDEGTLANTITSRQTALGGAAGQAGTTSGLCRISGTIVVNAAGTLLVQFAQNAASGTSSIVANSTFTIQQVP